MKYSKQRNLILSDLRVRTDHPTADMVYESASEVMPEIGIATVYRNLNVLAENGDILRIEGSGYPDRFDGNIEMHYHIRCRECGHLTDLFPKNMEAFGRAEEQLKKAAGAENMDVTLGYVIFEHVCDKCRTKS